MKINKRGLLSVLSMVTVMCASSIYAAPSTHSYYKGTQNSSPYLTTHDSLNDALERVDYLRQRGAKSLFMGKVSKIQVELLNKDSVNTNLSNTFVSLGAFGVSSNYQSLDISDMSQSSIYDLSIQQFNNKSDLDVFKANLGDSISIHYEGRFDDLTLDMRSIGLSYSGADNGHVLVHSKAKEVGEGSISISELQNVQNKLNQLYARQKIDSESQYITIHNEEIDMSDRKSKVFSGSETEIFHDFKFETNAYEKAAKEGYGNCKTISYSSQVDIKDLWERDVYSVVCYKL